MRAGAMDEPIEDDKSSIVEEEEVVEGVEGTTTTLPAITAPGKLQHPPVYPLYTIWHRQPYQRPHPGE